MSRTPTKEGRVASRVAEALKQRIMEGHIPVGQFLPGVRELSKEHGISPETARSAMKLLEREFLVRSHPGHGFKVTAISSDPDRAAPLAFILSGDQSKGPWTGLYASMLGVLQQATMRRGWSMLGLGTEGRSTTDIVEQLKHARVAGVLLDASDDKLLKELAKLGLPVVMIEIWSTRAKWDAVGQDNFGGGMKAAEYLLEKGHKKFGWYGPLHPTPESIERWGGAVAGLRESGAGLPAEHSINEYGDESDAKLRQLLSRADRPTAMFALWRSSAHSVVRVAQSLGLVPGRDLDLVGWCNELQWDDYAAGFIACPPPPTIVWSMKELAESALARLAMRRAQPDMPIVRINIAAELRIPSDKPAVS